MDTHGLGLECKLYLGDLCCSMGVNSGMRVQNSQFPLHMGAIRTLGRAYWGHLANNGTVGYSACRL
jgi:hypothetical protein